MKTGSTSTLILLEMIYITLIPALKAQKFSVLPEVTGYLGHDVILPCKFIKGPNDDINLVQWDLLGPEGNKTRLLVSNKNQLSIPDSPLKDKVNLTEQSLIIKDVEMKDEGSYSCTISTFPEGSFEGTTKLIVREQMPLSSSGVVSAVVIAVILLVGIMAAITYFIFIRRCNSSVSHSVFIGGTVTDVSRSSGIERAEDVVYSDVKFKPPCNDTTSNNDEHRKSLNADVTYAGVMVLGQRPR